MVYANNGALGVCWVKRPGGKIKLICGDKHSWALDNWFI